MFFKAKMYQVRLKLTGEEHLTDDPFDILNDYPLMMLVDSHSREKVDSDMLKDSSFEFDLEYDPLKISKLKVISDIQQAYVFIESKYWNKNFSIFDKSLSLNKDFVRWVIFQKRCNSSFKDFADELLNDIDFMTSIVEDDRWNGKLFYFGYNQFRNNKEFMKKAINLPNSTLETIHSSGYELMDDIDYLRFIMRSPKWNGDLNFITTRIKTRQFIHEVIKSKRWNGAFYNIYRIFTGDIETIRLVTQHPKWDGNCQEFELSKSDGLKIMSELISKTRIDCFRNFKFADDKPCYICDIEMEY